MTQRRISGNDPARLESALEKFAKAIGSKDGTDPIPPSNYLFFLDPTQPPLQQLLAWVRSKTIRFRHGAGPGNGRSPFAIDDNGVALGLADMARELNWKLPNASREWKKAEKLGLVRKEGKKLFLVGKVPKPKMGKRRRNVICTDNLPQSIQREIRTWSEARQLEFYAIWQAGVEFGAALENHEMTKARNSTSGLKDTILSHFGLERKHRTDRKAMVPLHVPEQLNLFVQITSNHAVQITKGDAVPITKGDVVPITSSLLSSEKTTESGETSSSSDDAKALATELQIDDDAATRLLTDCRERNPEITPHEIAILCGMKLSQLGKTVKNGVGVFITAVPKMATGTTYMKAHQQAQRDAEHAARQKADLETYEREQATGTP